jgi:hypothetical protein
MKKELTTYAATILISFIVGLVLGVICQRDFENKKVKLKVEIDSLQKSRIEKIELLLNDYRLVHHNDSILISQQKKDSANIVNFAVEDGKIKSDTGRSEVVKRFKMIVNKQRQW